MKMPLMSKLVLKLKTMKELVLNFCKITFILSKRDYLEGQLKTLAFPVKIKTLHKLAHFIYIK